MKKILIPLFAIILMLGMSTAAFAAVSPGPAIMPDTGVTVDKAFDATFDVKVTVTFNDNDGTYTVKVPTTSGDKTFDAWTVTGEYEIVSGSLTADTLVLKITDPARTSIVANYKSPETPTEAPTTAAPTEPDEEPKTTKKPDKQEPTKDKGDKGPTNDGPTSPDTGSAVASLGLVALLAAGVAITSKKKQK